MTIQDPGQFVMALLLGLAIGMIVGNVTKRCPPDE